MNVIIVIASYFIFFNLLGLILMGIDKHNARKKIWRIPEANLFTVALFGGSLGTTIGMFLFYYKTRHWYFLYGLPLILFLQLALCYYLTHASFNITIL